MNKDSLNWTIHGTGVEVIHGKKAPTWQMASHTFKKAACCGSHFFVTMLTGHSGTKLVLQTKGNNNRKSKVSFLFSTNISSRWSLKKVSSKEVRTTPQAGSTLNCVTGCKVVGPPPLCGNSKRWLCVRALNCVTWGEVAFGSGTLITVGIQWETGGYCVTEYWLVVIETGYPLNS